MAHWIAWVAAAFSTAAFLLLWFRDVRRIMRDRQSMLDSAAAQLEACQHKAAGTRYDPNAVAILERSEDIYQQSVNIYNFTLQKPWIYLPARLMGFRIIPYGRKENRRRGGKP